VSAIGLDPDAMLVALVLAPATYSRNRFHDLYTQPLARRVRRRAMHVRSVLRQLAQLDRATRDAALATEPEPDGGVALRFEVPALGLRRTTRLDALELAALRFALAQSEGAPLADDDPHRSRVESALHRLADADFARGRERFEESSTALVR
jgi:hypothetical protein